MAFDPENRATSLSATINGNTNSESATYDGDGIRATDDGVFFLNDGDVPVVELDSSGDVLTTNVYGPDGWRARNSAGSPPSYFTYDPQGNLVQSLYASASVGDVYYLFNSTSAYDGFGQALGQYSGLSGTNSAPGPVGFGGQWGYYTDQSTGLVLMGHRYYNPSNGRFLTRDPIGYGGGINLYGFVGNNPITKIDPEGTQEGVYSSDSMDLFQRAFSYATPSDWFHWFSDNKATHAVEETFNLASYIPDPANPAFDEKVGTLAVEGAAKLVEDAPEALSAAAQKMAKVRALGREGEAAGTQKGRIDSLTGTAKYRVPDLFDEDAQLLGDIKNAKKLDISDQMRDFLALAKENDWGPVFYVVRAGTVLGKSVQTEVNAGRIIIIRALK